MIVGARDGKISLYNTTNQFKLITVIDLNELGLVEEDYEVTCMAYVQFSGDSSLLAVGSGKGSLCIIDLAKIRIVYQVEDYVESELSCIHYLPSTVEEPARLLTCNFDQNLVAYDLKHCENLQKLKLKKSSTRCLFLDEVIEMKIFKPSNDYALLCSNSESLKLMHLKTGVMELYTGHTDIILCLDIC